MIGFLQPLALLALAAAAVPPLLHLLGRKLPPTVTFPAVRYLIATEREHSRRLRLRNLLLMLLRTAVIVFLVLAWAGPVVSTGLGGGHPPTALAIVLDNSLSSGAVIRGRRVLDSLVGRARAVLERATDEDRLWLALADGLPRRVGRSEMQAMLDRLTPWPVRLDLGRAVAVAARAVAQEARLPREVVVLSDLQVSALEAGEAPSVPVLVWEPPFLPANRSIDSARAEPRDWRPGGAVIAAVGGSDATPGAVRLFLREREAARSVARAGDRVVLGARVTESGWQAARVELDPDELRADDGWWVAVHRTEPRAVSVEPGAGPFVAEAVSVLQEGGRLHQGEEVLLSDRVAPGTVILFPPVDPSLVGALNRALAARAVRWRLGDMVKGEWMLAETAWGGTTAGTAVHRRYRLDGTGTVYASVEGEPWLVRDGDVVIVASRMERDWTDLPVAVGFVPFVDLLANRLAGREAWVVRARPGATVTLPPGVDAVELGGDWVAAPPDGRFRLPFETGVYLLQSGLDTVGAIEVNHDPRESLTAQADRRAVRGSLGAGARLLNWSELDRELFGGERRANLAGVLLAVAVLAALAELLLATHAPAAAARE
ncbi:MAG: BatA domain-containing protein [Gemmatimonadales bacterium]